MNYILLALIAFLAIILVLDIKGNLQRWLAFSRNKNKILLEVIKPKKSEKLIYKILIGLFILVVGYQIVLMFKFGLESKYTRENWPVFFLIYLAASAYYKRNLKSILVEEGILHPEKFIPWENVKNIEWEQTASKDLNVLVVSGIKGAYQYRIFVDPTQRADIDKTIRRNIKLNKKKKK